MFWTKVIKGFLHEKETDMMSVGLFDDIIIVDISHGYKIKYKKAEYEKKFFPRLSKLARKRNPRPRLSWPTVSQSGECFIVLMSPAPS